MATFPRPALSQLHARVRLAMTPSASSLAKPGAKLIAGLHASVAPRKTAPPTRDGDELRHPLEPADVRAFWDNARLDARAEGAAAGRTDADRAAVAELRELLATIIHRKAREGAVAMEVSTQRWCGLYESLDSAGRTAVLQTLAREFCTPKGAALEAARAYLDGASQSPDPARSAPLARALRDSLTPQYTELFDQINRLPGGFAFLVHMRADMLEYIRQSREDTTTRAMSDALMKKLETWIIGTLDLKRITWNSPACTIEKLGQYESVHAIKSWLDVKHRLGNGRRCFGFFHRSVPMEPLVFVWVALTDRISSDVQSILRERSPAALQDEDAATCAIFYSINSQPGLSGVDLGNFLIKRVVGILRAELPNVRTFCTLSPMPRFRPWLDGWLTPECLGSPPADVAVPLSAQAALVAQVPGAATWTAALKHIAESRGWASDQAKLDAMEPV
ncbi:hypothetical protein IWQ56_005018, partial [Coemansia nantahalensis]